MELLLIRHAEPVRVEMEEGPADPGLHDRGREQARALAGYLSTEKLDALYSSPLLRARETADPLARASGLELQVDHGITEFDQGSNSYIPMEELRTTKDERWLALAGGTLEGFDIDPAQFRDQAVGAIEGIVESNPGRKVAVVCHGGVINAYVGHVLGIDRLLWFEPLYSSIARLAASRHGPRSVLSLNEAPHLRRADTHT